MNDLHSAISTLNRLCIMFEVTIEMMRRSTRYLRPYSFAKEVLTMRLANIILTAIGENLCLIIDGQKILADEQSECLLWPFLQCIGNYAVIVDYLLKGIFLTRCQFSCKPITFLNG